MKRLLLSLCALTLVAAFSPPTIILAAEEVGMEYLLFQQIPNVVTPGRREMSIKQSPNAI